ncbi:MAG: hypothetical protein EOM80_09545, partial [Erysipelotrichia bacterium]|nr:hypothetical protein [Erysipelotrichia bacterium]
MFYGILRKMTPLDFLTFEVTVGVNSLVAWFGLATLPVLAAAAWREQWVAAFFSWFPWLTVALFALFCMCCPTITWWVVCVIALCLWLSCAVQRLVMQKWQRSSYILVAFDLLLVVTLFLDFHYFSITRAHISFQHIFVVLIGIMGRRDLAQFFKIIGVSYYHAAMLAVMIAAITAFTVVLMRFGSSVKPLAAKFMRNLVASFLLLGCVIASFSPLAGSLPFENYLEWRLNNCFFRLPDHPRLQNSAISAALNDTTVKLNFEQTARQGDYSWLAEPSTCNIVFLFVESWRPDMFEAYMPQTRELATRGMWLKNHFATTNDSLGGTTAVYYSTIPFLGPHGFASFFKPSTWLDFMKKSGYNLRRISNVGVTLAYPDYQYIGVEDAEKENAIQSPAGMSPVATGRTLNILLKELQKPGAHILEGVLYDTHYNYTYPPEFEKYKPVADVNADFIASGYDQTAVAGLANRYKNACGYIDHELGCF